MPEGDPEQDFDTESKWVEFNPDEEYPREDVGFGIGYLKYLIYIGLPLFLFYLLYTR